MIGYLKKHPWWIIVFAFVALMGAWTWLILVAVKNRPEMIEVPVKSSGDQTRTSKHE